MPFDVAAVRREFPALHQEVHGKPLTYLDSAASSMKPQVVIDALVGFYARDYSNVHRGVHALSQRATEAFEDARRSLARFLSATDDEVVFTRGTTEALNLVANAWSSKHLGGGDEVVISGMEHHSDIGPWQMACERHGAGADLRQREGAGQVPPYRGVHGARSGEAPVAGEAR